MRNVVLSSLCLLLCSTFAQATDRIWFSPLIPPPPGAPSGYLPSPGVQDYYSLFSANAPWAQAANRTGVFQMIVQTVDQTPDATLATMMSFLNSHNIVLALEAGPVNTPAGCNPWPGEGYGGISMLNIRLARIRAAGGNLAYIAMDEPFQFATHDAVGACKLSPRDLAYNIRDTLNFVRNNYFPNVKFGDVEPFIHTRDVVTNDYSGWAQQYATFLQEWKNATGVEMEFVHNEFDPGLAGWMSAEDAFRPVIAARGIKYGLIHSGMNTGATNNHDWVQSALGKLSLYRDVNHRTLPDHHIFQSWDGLPSAAMPESNPDTFTALVNHPALNVVMNIDTTNCGANCLSNWPGGYVGGWAIDRAANNDSGIDTIHVWNQTTGSFIGTSVFGARPDVAAYFGPQFWNSGFMVYVPPQPAGANYVCFYPHSSVSGTFVWDHVQCMMIYQ
jgi:hypothetical protein